MVLDWLKKFLVIFSKVNVDNKILLVLIALMLFNTNISNINKIERLLEGEKLEKIEAERYTERVTPIINTQIQYILMSDPDATNVILLNYHNNNHSSQGFSYKYITYLTEKFKDDENMHEEEFKELSYLNYGEEFSKIHNLKYLKVDSLSELQESFPKLYRKIKSCNAKSVAFYPIEGVQEPVGMIIVLYKNNPSNIDLIKALSPRIQRLAILLDYNQFKKHLEE